MTARVRAPPVCCLKLAPKHTMPNQNPPRNKTDGSTDTLEITEYDPFPDPRITITFDDNTRLTFQQFGKTEVWAKHETDSILPQTITDDRGDIREFINDINSDIPDDVERTARRLLQLDAWLETYNPTSARDSILNVYGTYRPLRDQQNQLYLVQGGNETLCDRVLPFVESVHKPTWSNRNQEIQPRLSQLLQKLTLRAVSAFHETKFKEDTNRTIVATEFQKVESLEEAERIVKGEPRVATNDSPDIEETTDQSSLNSF